MNNQKNKTLTDWFSELPLEKKVYIYTKFNNFYDDYFIYRFPYTFTTTIWDIDDVGTEWTTHNWC